MRLSSALLCLPLAGAVVGYMVTMAAHNLSGDPGYAFAVSKDGINVEMAVADMSNSR